MKTHTDPDDVILDNTMGSGTTCLAAKKLYRDYIGIENDPVMFEIAKERIETFIIPNNSAIRL